MTHIPHGFSHAVDWSCVSLGCPSCGYADRWDDIRGKQNERRKGKLTPRAKATRARIEADIREMWRARGCTHV